MGDVAFQVLSSRNLKLRFAARANMQGADFLLLKEQPQIERYVQIVEQMHPQSIFELGIFGGGSTALLLELAHPQVMIAVARQPPASPALHEYVERRGLQRVIHTTRWNKLTVAVWQRSPVRR